MSLPLSSLLGRALVAFTIELDNEWERRMPRYKTTEFGGRGVWGVSLRQYANFMRYLPEDGLAVTELTCAARAEPQLDGMRRWGYVTLEPGRRVRPSRRGLRAQEVWRPLPEEIERRWRDRFGAAVVGGLRAALQPLAEPLRPTLPDWITHHHGGYVRPPVDPCPPPAPPELHALLSLPLHELALRYERESGASLQFTANVLRPLGVAEGEGVALTELPRLSGVASPALQTAVGILAERGFVELGSGRGRRVTLTGKGAAEVSLFGELPFELEAGLGAAGAAVRAPLERLLASGGSLWPALDPPPESWRSSAPRPEVLPHHPHPRQGGHPDGV